MTLKNSAYGLAGFRYSGIAIVFASLLLDACAPPGPIIPEPLVKPRAELEAQESKQAAQNEQTLSTAVQNTPRPPEARITSSVKPASPAAAGKEKANITVAFDQMPLPSFIQAIYGLILKKNYSVDPQIASRKDLVTLHASELQTPDQIENAARLLLKTYGVAVNDLGAGNYRITPDNSQTGYAPEILRGRAMPEVPLPLRPIYQLVELKAVRNPDVAGWLRIMFGSKITLNEDLTRDAVLIGGQRDDVTAALEAIHVLDQPAMKGRQSIRINPVFWSADELAKKLTEVLQAEGYAAGIDPKSNSPLLLIPIQAINAVIVFAGDTPIIDHVVNWARELDKPNATRGAGSSYFSYQARYTNAQSLANTIQNLLGSGTVAQSPQGPGAPPGQSSPAAPGGNAQFAPTGTGRVVVNAATNTLIIKGGSSDSTELLTLLQELDRPAKSALIEVTVAEVTLDDSTQLGVEWALSASGANGATIVGGTVPGIAMGAAGATTGLNAATGGFTIARLNSLGNLRQMLNMLATSSKANVLSSPHILARNGETASIQVGSQIPTISMQQTNAATAGVGVLQSVQYIDTGVILKVKPIIYAGDRIDLDVSQEVSASNSVGVAGSPIIDTRKVETHLSLKDGSPVLLGGLISNTRSYSDTGVPWLKDIPVFGQLFRSNTDSNNKTELLVLITPYIISDDHDAQEITDAFRNRLGDWARSATPPLIMKAVKPVAKPDAPLPEKTAAPVSP